MQMVQVQSQMQMQVGDSKLDATKVGKATAGRDKKEVLERLALV